MILGLATDRADARRRTSGWAGSNTTDLAGASPAVEGPGICRDVCARRRAGQRACPVGGRAVGALAANFADVRLHTGSAAVARHPSGARTLRPPAPWNHPRAACNCPRGPAITKRVRDVRGASAARLPGPGCERTLICEDPVLLTSFLCWKASFDWICAFLEVRDHCLTGDGQIRGADPSIDCPGFTIDNCSV
jgi:hypothetical protein